MTDKRDLILQMLAKFVAQRPGLEFGNYGDVSAYRSEMRSITRDRHIFDKLLGAVSWRTSIDETALRQAFKDAFSGRLTLTDRADGKLALDYCTGQYFPTEYRKAACAVLASALWAYQRECSQAKVDDRRYSSLGDEIRHTFKREFGANIANRYFN